MVVTTRKKASSTNGDESEHPDSSRNVNKGGDENTAGTNKKLKTDHRHQIVKDQNANGKTIIRLCVSVGDGLSEKEPGNDEDTSMEDVAVSPSANGDQEPAAAEEDFQILRRTRDRFNRVLVDMQRLKGEETNEKRDFLLELLKETEVKILAGPKPIKVQGEPFYSVSVETEEEVQRLLTMEFKNVDDKVEPLFVRANDEWRQDRLRRSVEVYGLPPRTPEHLVKFALMPHGLIETISSHVCTRGIKVSFTVLFSSQEAIEKIKKLGTSSLFVGTEHARFGRIGEQRVTWKTGFVRKLAGLPRQTTPLDLAELLEIKATFIDVPKNFTGNRTQYRREAFVYFDTEADMEAASVKSVKIKETILDWCATEAKTCYFCGSSKHIKADCEDALKTKECRARTNQVKNYQGGQPLGKVIKRTSSAMSYASVAGNDQHSNGSHGGMQQTTQPKATVNLKSTGQDAPDRVDQLIALLEKEREENRRQREEDKQKLDTLFNMMTTMMAFVMQTAQGSTLETQQSAVTATPKKASNDKERNPKEKEIASGNSGNKGCSLSSFPTPNTPAETVLAAITALLTRNATQRHTLPAIPAHKMPPKAYSDLLNV